MEKKLVAHDAQVGHQHDERHFNNNNNNNMLFLYSAFSCQSWLKTPYILFMLLPLAGRPVTFVTCSTSWGVYTRLHAQGATGNLSTIAISVYRQVLILRLSEQRHHCRHP